MVGGAAGVLMDSVCQETEPPDKQEDSAIEALESPDKQHGSAIEAPESPDKQDDSAIEVPEPPDKQDGSAIEVPEPPDKQDGSAIEEPESPDKQHDSAIEVPESPDKQDDSAIESPESPNKQDDSGIQVPGRIPNRGWPGSGGSRSLRDLHHRHVSFEPPARQSLSSYDFNGRFDAGKHMVAAMFSENSYFTPFIISNGKGVAKPSFRVIWKVNPQATIGKVSCPESCASLC